MEPLLLLTDAVVATSDVALFLADATESPASGGGGYPDWESPAVAPPGLEEYANTWIGWTRWIAAFIAFIAFVAAGIMMMVGKFTSRSATSADGLRQLVWALGGACVVASATSIIAGLLA